MTYIINGETGPWELVCGLEVHAQVASNAKLFSGAAISFGAEQNTHVSLVDAAFPGMLPVINRQCVEQAIKTGLGLNARINLKSRFDRKNYFYPDLPQGYQISQGEHPIVGEGVIQVLRDDGTTFEVEIERLHLEQDAGKLIHERDHSLVDLNRSGVALMEIVSRPDIRSPEDAAAYVKTLREIVRTLGTCDGDMEKGNLRADVNVSVRRPGAGLGTRCEIKNVNSMRFIQQAIVYESRRQVELLEAGQTIDQETRLFDAVRGETRSMRSKEDAHDYRYFPDPDLLPLVLDPAWIDAIRKTLPELPQARRERLERQYALSPYDARVLGSGGDLTAFYEDAVAGRDPKLTANWVTNDLMGHLTRDALELHESPVDAGALAQLVRLIEDKVISSKIARDVFERMWNREGSAEEIVKAHNLVQMNDTSALETMVDQLIADNPKQVDAVRAKPQALGWFVGQVMKQTGGRANPATVNTILRAKLAQVM